MRGGRRQWVGCGTEAHPGRVSRTGPLRIPGKQMGTEAQGGPRNSAGGGGGCGVRDPKLEPWEVKAVLTWLPPLLGFTNTSRGFMSGDGVGLMMKGLQRLSLGTQSL